MQKLENLGQSPRGPRRQESPSLWHFWAQLKHCSPLICYQSEVWHEQLQHGKQHLSTFICILQLYTIIFTKSPKIKNPTESNQEKQKQHNRFKRDTSKAIISQMNSSFILWACFVCSQQALVSSSTWSSFLICSFLPRSATKWLLNFLYRWYWSTILNNILNP